MLTVLKLALGVSVCALCAVAPWAMPRAGNRRLGAVLVATGFAAALGTALGVPAYPVSNLVVLAVAISGGVLLGRALPPRFAIVLIALLALSALDLIQVVAFGRPPPPSAGATNPSFSPDPHLIWLNFRIQLPSGHFNVGFADLLLVTALAENFRRRSIPWSVALIPGVFAIVAGTLIASTALAQQTLGGAFSQALVPYLTVGWLLAFGASIWWTRGDSNP